MKNNGLKRNIESAGVWFVAEYSGEIYSQFERISNSREYKKEFIKEVYFKQGRDKDYGGTATRINAVMRIIKNGDLMEALEYVVSSERMQKENPKAIAKATDTLRQFKVNK
ncbi:hypothetical protein LG275_12980 [Chryseomicrobium palamuruense]